MYFLDGSWLEYLAQIKFATALGNKIPENVIASKMKTEYLHPLHMARDNRNVGAVDQAHTCIKLMTLPAIKSDFPAPSI